MPAGIDTRRRMGAVKGEHDRTTARRMDVITTVVSTSQIIQTSDEPPPPPPRRRTSASLSGDVVSLDFFEEGHRQEAEGVFKETTHVPISSLDRVPRRW